LSATYIDSVEDRTCGKDAGGGAAVRLKDLEDKNKSPLPRGSLPGGDLKGNDGLKESTGEHDRSDFIRNTPAVVGTKRAKEGNLIGEDKLVSSDGVRKVEKGVASIYPKNIAWFGLREGIRGGHGKSRKKLGGM